MESGRDLSPGGSPLAVTTRVMVIRCPRCHKRVFRYLKVGKGRVIRCYKDRIKEDRAVRKDGGVSCVCGARLGRDEGDHIKMLVPLRLG